MYIKHRVNALHLTCPEPLLRLRVALNAADLGECVEVLTNDASSVRDFHRLAELTGHQMVLFEELENHDLNHGIAPIYRFVLQKG